MDLPNEMLLQIISHLARSDLKAARLVSNIWYLYSSEYLFDTIYVSTQDEDFTVFKAVAQHPTLSNCVRTLEYDPVAFDTTLSLSDYVKRLWDQLACIARRDRGGHHDRFDNSDPDVNELVHLLRKQPTSGDNTTAYMAEVQKLCQGTHLIQEAYADWKRRAEREVQIKANGCFAIEMMEGLRNLTRLHSVRLNSVWPVLDFALSSGVSLPKVCYGSPLARQWKIFQVFPLNWYWGPNAINGPGHSQGIADFYNVAWALTTAGKHPRTFKGGPSLPPTVFALGEDPKFSSSWLPCLCTYTDLHRLELDLDHYGNLRELGNLNGLQWLLSNTKNLQHLELILPTDKNPYERAKFFCYDKFFPAHVYWPKLVFFSVHNLSLHLKDFIRLFSFASMRNLKTLEIGNMELLSGTWEAAIEILKYGLLGLDTLRIVPSSFLHDGSPNRRQFITPKYDDDFENDEYSEGGDDSENDADSEGDDHSEDDDDPEMTFVEDTCEYVAHGRVSLDLRHPCLHPSYRDEAALEYLRQAQEICETTRAHSNVLALLGMYVKRATEWYALQESWKATRNSGR